MGRPAPGHATVALSERFPLQGSGVGENSFVFPFTEKIRIKMNQGLFFFLFWQLRFRGGKDDDCFKVWATGRRVWEAESLQLVAVHI